MGLRASSRKSHAANDKTTKYAPQPNAANSPWAAHAPERPQRFAARTLGG